MAADLWETLDYAPATEEIIDVGEHVVVVLRISGRGTRSDVPVAQRVAIAYTFVDEPIVRGKSFTSRAEALEAVGGRHQGLERSTNSRSFCFPPESRGSPSHSSRASKS